MHRASGRHGVSGNRRDARMLGAFSLTHRDHAHSVRFVSDIARQWRTVQRSRLSRAPRRSANDARLLHGRTAPLPPLRNASSRRACQPRHRPLSRAECRARTKKRWCGQLTELEIRASARSTKPTLLIGIGRAFAGVSVGIAKCVGHNPFIAPLANIGLASFDNERPNEAIAPYAL